MNLPLPNNLLLCLFSPLKNDKSFWTSNPFLHLLIPPWATIKHLFVSIPGTRLPPPLPAQVPLNLFYCFTYLDIFQSQTRDSAPTSCGRPLKYPKPVFGQHFSYFIHFMCLDFFKLNSYFSPFEKHVYYLYTKSLISLSKYVHFIKKKIH